MNVKNNCVKIVELGSVIPLSIQPREQLKDSLLLRWRAETEFEYRALLLDLFDDALGLSFVNDDLKRMIGCSQKQGVCVAIELHKVVQFLRQEIERGDFERFWVVFQKFQNELIYEELSWLSW